MEDQSFGYIEEEILEIVRRYESMRKNNKNYFFDVAEFETIIDYYLDLNDVTYAYEAAETASKQHPASSSIQLRKAKVLIDKGRPVDVLKITKLIAKIEPSNHEVFLLKGAALGMLGDLNGTRRNFDIALSLDEAEEINILLNITAILNNLNHYALLTNYLERLVELEPDYSMHLYDLAYAYEKLGDIKNSIKYYGKYLDEEPFSDNAWYNLGLLYTREGMIKKALDAYQYSIAVNPDNFFAIFNMANILSKEGRYSEALEAYLHYLEFEEESSEAVSCAAECYGKTGDRKKALKMFNKAIDMDPDYPEPWYGLGLLLLDEKPGESVKYFRKAVTLKDDEPEYWYYLSEAYYKCDRLKDAFRSLLNAVNIDPYYDNAWLKIGKIIIEGGYYRHAGGLLEKGMKVIGDVHGIRYILASTYLFSGNNDMFRTHLEKAIDDSPGYYNFFSSLFPEERMEKRMRKLVRKNVKE
ncbi:MAG TPA: tetratricopeptide repeat protein [Bacteroidaceae bacterium]|nr:tetratricopeptide repeat protein [Bacteroidaceae bacterium]